MSLGEAFGISLIFGIIQHLWSLQKISVGKLYNSFCVKIFQFYSKGNKVLRVPYCFFCSNICFCTSLLKFKVCLQVWNFLHDINILSIYNIDFINSLWLFVIWCCKIKMFILLLLFHLSTKNPRFHWMALTFDNHTTYIESRFLVQWLYFG
jgi:hypothetical protein